jgi:hypothetical protein
LSARVANTFAKAGLLYQGLVPERSQDALGLFAIFGEFSSDLREAERISHQAAMRTRRSWS